MILDGKAIADQILLEIKEALAKVSGRKPCLGVLLAGQHPASEIYVARKIQACNAVGILSRKETLPATAGEDQILRVIDAFNRDTTVDGILVQLPLPEGIPSVKINQAIDPEKDVDGFHPVNMGKLLLGEKDGFYPCTPLGIQVLLERYQIPIAGKHVVIIGRSNIVGKPLAALLMQNAPGANATVTVAHSHTQDLPALCQTADILVAALGSPLFIKAEMIKKGAVVIDVGISRIAHPTETARTILAGDVDFARVKEKAGWLTPVPGGVGPMTIAMLLSNTLKSFKRRA